MLLSIITLNYKKPELTLTCLASLQEQLTEKFQARDIEVIVVDNDSQDDSVEKMGTEVARKKYTNTRILASGSNGGFGKGNNFGAKRAKGDYLLFLNNDTTVSDQSILSMVEYLQKHDDVAILGGQMVNPDGSLQASTGSFYSVIKTFFLLLGLQKFGLLDTSPKQIAPVDWVKGSLLLIRKEVFDKLGGFDEKIFMYTEDMELCYRAKKKGYKVYFYPETRVTHAEHGSGNRAFAIVNIYKGLLYFYKKHKSNFAYSLVKGMLVSKAWIAIGIGTLLGKSELVETYKKALQW